MDNYQAYWLEQQRLRNAPPEPKPPEDKAIIYDQDS